MKRIVLLIALGLIMAGLVLILTNNGSSQPEVWFQPSAAYDHPVNGRSFRFDLTNRSSSLVEVEVIRTEPKTLSGWQVITNISSPELHRFGPEAAADVPLPVGPQTWRAVLRYRKMPGRIENSAKGIAFRTGLISAYTPAPWTTNFSPQITQ